MIEKEKDLVTFYPKNRAAWQEWLALNHASTNSVWLIYDKKQKGIQVLTYQEALDDALCFGWIDSTRKSMDEKRFMQFFCKRKPTSVWSKINKAKVADLIAAGLMTAAGYKSIEIAKNNGSWSILDEVEELVVPADLLEEFALHPGALAFFSSLSKSVKKAMLQWLVLAKRKETRQNRIHEIASFAAQQMRPKQFR